MLEWTGTEILIMDNVKEDTMSFSAIASTKCVVFCISHEDLKLLPVNLRLLLTEYAHHRVEKNINQGIIQYKNLKKIKKELNVLTNEKTKEDKNK